MTIDLTFTQGEDLWKASRGIYKIEGNMLTICRAAPDKAHPAEFASAPSTGLSFKTYRRDQQKPSSWAGDCFWRLRSN